MKTRVRVLTALVSVSMVAGTAFAATKSADAPKKHAVVPEGEPPDLGNVMTGDEFDKAIADANARGARNMANIDTNMEMALSDSFRNIRNEIIGGPRIADGKETADVMPGIKTPAKLHELLKRLNDDKYYATLAPDAQYAAAQMAPLIATHALFNRTIELIQPNPISHLAVVGALRAIASSVMVYMPTPQWEAGMQYLVVPSNDMGPIIANEDDLHHFIEAELLPVIAKSVVRLEKLNFAGKPIYFDNKVFYGTANFASEQDRYVRIGEPERRVAIATAFAAASALESVNAYQLNGVFKAIDQIAKSAGYNSMFGFNPDGTQARRRFEIIRAVNQTTGLFNLRPNGAGWMGASYKALTGAVANSIIAWHELRVRAGDKNAFADNANAYGVLLDPRSFMGADRVLSVSASNMRYIVTGAKQQQIQSAVVSNEGREVSLQTFFANPPRSLVDLMPPVQGGFDNSPYNVPAMINGKPRIWHNYLAGRPVAWPLAEYKKIFPEIKTNADIPFTARVLSQTWGGWILGVPMSALVL